MNTTSSRRATAAKSTWRAHSDVRRGIWCRSSVIWACSEITAGKIQDYRIHRHEEAVAKRGKPPARNTMHQETVALRQTLETAIRHGWLDRLPDLSEPLGQGTWSASRCKNSYFAAFFGESLPAKRAIVALSHSLLVVCYDLLQA